MAGAQAAPPARAATRRHGATPTVSIAAHVENLHPHHDGRPCRQSAAPSPLPNPPPRPTMAARAASALLLAASAARAGASAALLIGCGQRGPLYLPARQQTTPPSAAPATPAPPRTPAPPASPAATPPPPHPHRQRPPPADRDTDGPSSTGHAEMFDSHQTFATTAPYSWFTL